MCDYVRTENVRLLLKKKIEEVYKNNPVAAERLARIFCSDIGIAWIAKQRQNDALWHSVVMQALDVKEVRRRAQVGHQMATAFVSEYVEVSESYKWLEKYLRKAGVLELDVVDQRQMVADRVARNVKSLREVDAFGSWIKRIAGTVAKEYRRVHQLEEELSIRAETAIQPDYETGLVLGQVWGKLSKRSRDVLKLHLADKSTQEISISLKMTLSCAKSYLQKARTELRSVIHSMDAITPTRAKPKSAGMQVEISEKTFVAGFPPTGKRLEMPRSLTD